MYRFQRKSEMMTGNSLHVNVTIMPSGGMLWGYQHLMRPNLLKSIRIDNDINELLQQRFGVGYDSSSCAYLISWQFTENAVALRWRHKERDGVSNHQPHDCLPTVYSGADQRKHQSSASLAFVWGIHRSPVNFPHKGPVTRKLFPLMTSSCYIPKFYVDFTTYPRINLRPGLSNIWTGKRTFI